MLDLAAITVQNHRFEAVHRPDELGHERSGGRAVHLGRGPDLLDPPRPHHGDVVRDRQRFLLIVGDIERRDSKLCLDPADLLPQLDAHLRVERRQRLVEEQHARLDRQCARECDALLHSAGELVRIPLPGVAQSHELEQFRHTLPPRRPFVLADPQSELDVLLCAHVREEAVRLENHAHVTVVGRRTCDVFSVDHDRTAIRTVETGDEAERRRLPASRRPEQGEELSLFHGDVDPVERDHWAERPPQLFQFEIRHQRVAAICAGR